MFCGIGVSRHTGQMNSFCIVLCDKFNELTDNLEKVRMTVKKHTWLKFFCNYTTH